MRLLAGDTHRIRSRRLTVLGGYENLNLSDNLLRNTPIKTDPVANIAGASDLLIAYADLNSRLLVDTRNEGRRRNHIRHTHLVQRDFTCQIRRRRLILVYHIG